KAAQLERIRAGTEQIINNAVSLDERSPVRFAKRGGVHIIANGCASWITRHFDSGSISVHSVAVEDLKRATRYIINPHSTIKGHKNSVPVSIGHISVLVLGHTNYVQIVVRTV